MHAVKEYEVETLYPWISRCDPWFDFKRFSEMIDGAYRLAQNKTVLDIVSELKSLSPRVKEVERYGKGKFLVVEEQSEAIAKKKLPPSAFISYRSCARRMFIEFKVLRELGGVLVSEDGLRSMYRGLVVHDVWRKEFASGDTEYRVEDDDFSGYIDEAKHDIPAIIEVKSGYRPDLLAVSLQAMAYGSAYKHQRSLESYPAMYIVTPSGVYSVTFNERVFAEYKRRLSKILEIAISGDVSRIPPPLESRMSSRCASCPYRQICLTLPVPYRSWSEYFVAMGFTKLMEREARSTLFAYSR